MKGISVVLLIHDFKENNSMKKILIALLCIFCVLPVFALSTEVNLGLVGQQNNTLESTLDLESEQIKVDFNQFNFGAVADAKVAIADVNMTAFCTKVDEINVLNGVLSGNVVLDIVFVRVGLGLGVNYLFDAENGFRFVGGDFLNANLSLRAEVDVVLGDLKVGLYGTVPTLYTLSNITSFKYSDVDLENFWKAAVVGISVKSNLL